MTFHTPDALVALASSVEGFRVSLRNSRGVHVGAAPLRESAKAIVQGYFRDVRRNLVELRCDETKIADLDSAMQHLLRLSNGRNRKQSYTDAVGVIKRLLQDLEGEREVRIGEQGHSTTGPQTLVYSSFVEGRILATLQPLLPTAALSYEQALRDLADPNRVSFRGTANELREALRELLDHLAPDAAVMGARGFRLETGQTTPTQKQKMRFILKSRELPEGAMKAPEDSVNLVAELTASITRSTYTRAAVATHVLAAKQEVLQMKMYVDSVLAELLEIHR